MAVKKVIAVFYPFCRQIFHNLTSQPAALGSRLRQTVKFINMPQQVQNQFLGEIIAFTQDAVLGNIYAIAIRCGRNLEIALQLLPCFQLPVCQPQKPGLQQSAVGQMLQGASSAIAWEILSFK